MRVPSSLLSRPGVVILAGLALYLVGVLACVSIVSSAFTSCANSQRAHLASKKLDRWLAD